MPPAYFRVLSGVCSAVAGAEAVSLCLMTQSEPVCMLVTGFCLRSTHLELQSQGELGNDASQKGPRTGGKSVG